MPAKISRSSVSHLVTYSSPFVEMKRSILLSRLLLPGEV
ncbi:hypothetical protein ACHAXN_009575 [Cyclotella atomus]